MTGPAGLRAILAGSVFAVGGAGAAEVPWPPPAAQRARLDELRSVLADPASTMEARHAARAEIAKALHAPGTIPAPIRTPASPRAAVPIAPAVARPASPLPPAAGTVTPVAPARRPAMPIPDGKGGTVVPGTGQAVDPRTGRLLIDAGNGYVDPLTGRFVPKP